MDSQGWEERHSVHECKSHVKLIHKMEETVCHEKLNYYV